MTASDDANTAGDGSRPKREGPPRKRKAKAARQDRPADRRPPRRVTPGGPRHLARIIALQVLYEVDVADHAATDVLRQTFEDPALGGEDEAPDVDALADVRARVERLVRGVMEHFREIDPYIASAAPAFPIAQLPAVDRNVLRLAIYELLREPDVPVKAAINEAVELAKRYGGDNSGRFVNGVLGTVAERIETEGIRGTPPAAEGDAPEAPE